MKKIFYVFCCIFFVHATNSSTFAQNNIWSLPGNFYDMDFGIILPLPTGPEPEDYQGQPSLYTHNAMQDAQGKLLFFVVDGVVYDPVRAKLKRRSAGRA